MTSTARPRPTAANPIELSIGGMTCASCAARIEKKGWSAFEHGALRMITLFHIMW